MQAAWYEESGSAEDVLTVGGMDTPSPGAGEILVRLETSGVNPSDVKSREGSRGGLPFPRIIPHSDGGGVIEEVGEGVCEDRIGERVWTYNAAWKRPFGTAAQYVALPAALAVPLPDNTSFETAACLGIPAMTAHRCVLADGDVEGKTVLVTGGAGAVGHFAIQFAKLSGATVITTVSGDEKGKHAKTAGADHVLNYKSDDVVGAVEDLTHGEGVDQIVEVEFGGNLDVTKKVIKLNGIVVAYGSQAVRTPEIPFYPLMFKGVTLRLVLVYVLPEDAREASIRDINRLLREDKLNAALWKVVSLEEIATAHQAVESGDAIGNVVLSIA